MTSLVSSYIFLKHWYNNYIYNLPLYNFNTIGNYIHGNKLKHCLQVEADPFWQVLLSKNR